MPQPSLSTQAVARLDDVGVVVLDTSRSSADVAVVASTVVAAIDDDDEYDGYSLHCYFHMEEEA